MTSPLESTYWKGQPVQPARLLLACLLLTLAAVAVNRAWLGDDAFITLRVLDNLLEGHGLRYNIHERVQVSTHPLWLWTLLPLYWAVRDPWVALLVPGLLFTALAIWVLTTRLVRENSSRILLLGGLILSPSFVDYVTSGLENPLTHFLLVLLLLEVLKREAPRVGVLSLITSLLFLTRPDAVLLSGPVLVWFVLQRPTPRQFGRLALGLMPALLWMTFALVYFGSPLPNTAFAKLNSGFPRWELIGEGFSYYLVQLRFDPLLVAVLGGGIGLSFASGNTRQRLLSGGAFLYLIYVLYIGGEHMIGRFMTAPFLIALTLLAGFASRLPTPVAAGSALAATFLSLLSWSSPLARSPKRVKTLGIGDERISYKDLALADNYLFRSRRPPKHAWVAAGLKIKENDKKDFVVQVGGAAGLRSYYAGIKYRFIDQHALTDPFLSRLPAAHTDRWRPGHLARRIPLGYLRSVSDGEGHVFHQDLAGLHKDVRLAHAGDFFETGRWGAIWRLHTGYHSQLPSFEHLQRGGATTSKRLAPLSRGKNWKISLFADEALTLRKGAPAQRIGVLGSGPADYVFDLYGKTGYLGEVRVEVEGEGKASNDPVRRSAALPPKARDVELYEVQLRIESKRKHQRFQVKRIWLER